MERADAVDGVGVSPAQHDHGARRLPTLERGRVAEQNEIGCSSSRGGRILGRQHVEAVVSQVPLEESAVAGSASASSRLVDMRRT